MAPPTKTNTPSSELPILAAGEIGSYTVCPQAWVLRTINRVKSSQATATSIQGKVLHQAWAAGHDEVLGLARFVRVALLLLAFAALLLVWLSIKRGSP